MKGWKKYSAIAMAAAVTAGVCTQGSALYRASTASAQETEETQRTTLNIVTDDDENEASETEKISGAQETETDMPLETAEETEITEETGSTDSGDAVLGSGQSMGTVESVSNSASLTDVSEVVSNCLPSVVSVTVISEEEETESDYDAYYEYYYGIDTSETETGTQETTVSGIIIAQSEDELMIVTGYQAVSDAEDLTVRFSVEAEDEEDLTVSAKVKSSSAGSGLAVLAGELEELEENVLSQLKIANLGSSEDLKMGQMAVVLSDCGYGQVATVGIISATNLTVTLNDVSMEVILTDAADGCSSGGALLNTSGELIGICVTDDSGENTDGIGYAIPIDTAVPILEQLVNKETRDKLSDSERGY
ncbi:MAG: S1C family serine protease, partial [Clostridiales bacterium]|nr:S1C family serine protease [Clostridiales bacterium]